MKGSSVYFQYVLLLHVLILSSLLSFFLSRLQVFITILIGFLFSLFVIHMHSGDISFWSFFLLLLSLYSRLTKSIVMSAPPGGGGKVQ